jgi:LAO/AO transport system ATPase
LSKQINPQPKHRWKFELPDLEHLRKQILASDRSALSTAISLAESQLSGNRKSVAEMLVDCKSSWVYNRGLRIGVTGPPGVGKSTFIEQLGMYACANGYKVAVLAVDPTSNESKGSILGDKTRMEQLSQQHNAYIRPNPSGEHLGGLTVSTTTSTLLCEAAGYDLTIVESVGVGQSEIEIQQMVDIVILLLQPGAGDDVQGIKKGILEIADIMVVNKMDGDQLNLAKSKIGALQRLYPQHTIVGNSSLSNTIEPIYSVIMQKGLADFTQQRSEQLKHLANLELERVLIETFNANAYYRQLGNVQPGDLPISSAILLEEYLLAKFKEEQKTE